MARFKQLPIRKKKIETSWGNINTLTLKNAPENSAGNAVKRTHLLGTYVQATIIYTANYVPSDSAEFVSPYMCSWMKK